MQYMQKFRRVARNTVARVPAIALVALSSVPAAFAQTADFDPQTVITKITTFVGYGTLILGAFALGVWTLRTFGLIGGKR